MNFGLIGKLSAADLSFTGSIEVFDYIVVGAGIVGLATARELSHVFPGASIAVLEKEASPALHQTGHNSGVIHAGVYYAPGSMKAEFCRAGMEATIGYAKKRGVAYEQCGKMLVATSDLEVERMVALRERCRQNQLPVESLSSGELNEREPNIVGKGALFVSTTGIVDYVGIANAMVAEVKDRGGDFRFGSTVRSINETDHEVVIETDTETVRGQHLVVCAGLQADRLAQLAGIDIDFVIIPFRGEYYKLSEQHDSIVNHLIYPIPDPELPFLGVHLTKMIGGYVTVGPNAVLGLAREGYSKTELSPRDLYDMVRFPGFWKVMRDNLKSGITEMRNSFSKKRYLDLCRRYAPGLELVDLQPYPAGVRAQAVMRDGSLQHDFLIKRTRRSVHVCNAPSPAATSAMPIARHLVQQLVAA